MSTAQPRRPAGAPTGGQFASKSQPAPGYTLDADDSPGQATIDGRPVEPVVEVQGDGGRTESYYRGNQRRDPDDGRPAIVGYYPDGTVKSEWHCRDGQLHDPDDGRPAVVDYRTDGTVETAGHWQCGVRQD